MWMELVVAQSRYYPEVSLERLRIHEKNVCQKPELLH
jgi:hypothetical protein